MNKIIIQHMNISYLKNMSYLRDFLLRYIKDCSVVAAINVVIMNILIPSSISRIVRHHLLSPMSF